MYELRTAKGAGQGTPTDARLPLRANLKAGVTYYFECGGSGGAYTATLSRKDNVDDALYCDDMLKAPTDATALELDKQVPCAQDGAWFSFTPDETCIYLFSARGDVTTPCKFEISPPPCMTTSLQIRVFTPQKTATPTFTRS